MNSPSFLILSTLALVSCTAKDDSGTAPLSGDLVVTDANVYDYTTTMAVDAFEVAAWGDVLVTWDQLTTDIRGRPIADPGAIDKVILVHFGLTQDAVLEAIGSNGLVMSDIRDYRILDNDAGLTEAHLSDFSVLGNQFDPASEFGPVTGDDVWAVTLWDTGDGRDDILTLVFLVPTEGSTTLQVDITDDTASLDFQVDLHSADALRTAAGLTYTLDWSGVTTDAAGHPFDELAADRLLVGHLATDSISEVEAGFIRLDDEMDQIYRLDVYGLTSAALADATDASGQAFPGFTTEGTWIVGVDCTTCTSPAPVIASVVDVVK